ncbi:hypothetical protein ABZ468_48675, partial [Streptomyces sp. NPDC005708]
APAVAGAWAAVESLLSHPDDPKSENERSGKAVAADRMAAIIACSWPRAELTALAHRHKPRAADDLAKNIADCGMNQERARLVADALRERGAGALDFTGASTKYTDAPAAQPMTDLVHNPRTVPVDVARAFRVALRRLYRTRNTILHGGATQGVVLAASLRTAAPLVGAGSDRIVQAAYAAGLDPLDLAARAEVRPQPRGRRNRVVRRGPPGTRLSAPIRSSRMPRLKVVAVTGAGVVRWSWWCACSIPLPSNAAPARGAPRPGGTPRVRHAPDVGATSVPGPGGHFATVRGT